jgi:hypothetical protein
LGQGLCRGTPGCGNPLSISCFASRTRSPLEARPRGRRPFGAFFAPPPPRKCKLPFPLALSAPPVENQFDFKSGGNPARVVELIRDTEGVFVRQKLYMTESRLYELVCVVPTNQISSREIPRFFDSLRIIR